MAKKITNKREIVIKDITIGDFFKTDYNEYSIYTIKQRGLPSIVDGLKPSARKIMYSAFHILTESKKTKFIDLIGTTLTHSEYHHGDASLEKTIYNLGKEFTDNLSPLLPIGSVGDLRNPEQASPRYLYVKLHEFSRLYKKDYEILEYNYEGDKRIEPIVYLPIIPTLLANQTTGISIGFAYKLFCAFNPLSITKCCLEVLKTGKLKKEKLIPHINGFTGTFEKEDLTIRAIGRCTIDLPKKTVIINEFSPNESLQRFENNLNKMMGEFDKDDKTKSNQKEKQPDIIKWSDESSDDQMEYKVVLSDSFIKKCKGDEKLIRQRLKIDCTFTKNTLVMLDEHNEIIIFDTVEEILSYFVKYRLTWYDKAKNHHIKKINEKIQEMSCLRKFIDLYLKNKIVINNKTPLSETEKQIVSHGLDKSLVHTKLSKLTAEEYKRLGLEIKEKEKELHYIQGTTPLQMYENDLKGLIKEWKDKFPYMECKIL